TTVAVVDTGVDASHPDLSGSILDGVDLLSPPLSANGHVDAVGHGTAMAGLIAGHGRALGIAPGAKVIPISAIRGDLVGASGDRVAEAINWAADHGARIISLSLASPVPDENEREAIDRAISRDVVVVAGMGNRPGQVSTAYPAKYPGVVAVTG